MNQLDDILGRVREAPFPDGFDRLQGSVLQAIVDAAPPSVSARPMGFAAIAALMFGVLGGLPGSRVEAAEPQLALGEVPSLAPSALLASNW